MFKYLVIVLLVIFGVLAWMATSIGVPKIYQEDLEITARPHVYGSVGAPIDEIWIGAVYFVPSNKAGAIDTDWKKHLEEGLKDLQDFHFLQFQGRSRIYFDIYPAPIIGDHENLVYDTDVTQFGNPYALINVSGEIEDRVFKPDGDLYISEYGPKSDRSYPVLLVLYEGVGASGGVVYESENKTVEDIASEIGLPESVIHIVDIEAVDGFLLLNREFLAGTYGSSGSSLLAHEFYHTIGVPDAYIAPKAIPTSEDLMGVGRRRSLEKTYISVDTLKELGL